MGVPGAAGPHRDPGRRRALGVTRQALSDLVNEKAGVSVEMAHRLSQAFGSTPETWLRMQMAYDRAARLTRPVQPAP